MALTQAIKLWLNRSSVEAVVEKVLAHQLTMADLEGYAASNSDFQPKLADVKANLQSRPDPEEVKQYRALTEMSGDDDAVLLAVNSYLRAWRGKGSAAAHVAEIEGMERRLTGKRKFAQLEEEVSRALEANTATGAMPGTGVVNAIRDFLNAYRNDDYAAAEVARCNEWADTIRHLMAEAARREWAMLVTPDGKLADFDAARRFLTTYSLTEQRKAQLDDMMWNWALSQPDIQEGVRRYTTVWTSGGRHMADIARLARERADWENSLRRADIYSLINFAEHNPGHLFIGKVKERIADLKRDTLDEIRRAPNAYPYENFLELRRSGVFTDEELKDAAGASDALFDRILNLPTILNSLPPSPDDSTRFGTGLGEEGLTDVVFFGISSTGKTCLLSGLLLNDRLWFDERRFSGDYGSLVHTYARNGVALQGTPKNFIATIKASVMGRDNKHYDFNLFEMAGEAFYDRIVEAIYSDGGAITSFADMGMGAPEIFNTPNPKIFFIVIDPTKELVEQDDQVSSVKKLISLMFGDENGVNPNVDVMSKVIGLHFIVTKSDTLPPSPTGKLADAAHDAVCRVVNEAGRRVIVEGCRQFGINASRDPNEDGVPLVFAYSLGHFTVGNIFEYDRRGSDDILDTISDYCVVRRSSFGDKIRDFFTNPFA